MSKDATINGLLQRIEKLERAVFRTAKPAPAKKAFDGATGGVRFLIDNNFFSRRRFFHEVEAELKKHDYHYSKSAIQMPLNRLSSSKGPLVALKDKGKKVYVKRK